jgi:hypothetical protein
MVIAYILSVVLSIVVGSLGLALALWIMDDKAKLSDLSEDFRTCAVYNVIMQLVGSAVFGVAFGTESVILALIGITVYFVLAFKLLMDWFDLGFLSVLLLFFVALFVNYLALTTAYTFIEGLIG